MAKYSHFSKEKATPAEVEKSKASVSRGGLVALGVVFGVFATIMMAFIGFLIYRERTGNPSFKPRVSERTFTYINLFGETRNVKSLYELFLK